jgi:hypothetical protein
VSKTNSWWGTGINSGDQSDESEFHCYMFPIIKLINILLLLFYKLTICSPDFI